MAAGEDQTEAIVLDLFIRDPFISTGSVVGARFQVGNKISLRSIDTRLPAHAVNRFESCR